jgi:uncharacterized membrane protein YqjE
VDPRQEPIGELTRQLADQTGRLVRDEIRLARAELTEKAKRYGRAGGMLGAAIVILLLAAIAFTMFLIYLVGLAMPLWTSALVVGAAYGVVGLGLALVGKRQLDAARTPVPEQTVESVKEDVEWLRTRTRSDAR